MSKPGKPGNGWLLALGLAGKALGFALPVGAGFVLVTALCSGLIEAERWRWMIGLTACVLAPALVWGRLTRALESRKKKAPALLPFLALVNGSVALVLAFGFADDSGRALRRHSDWFLGERYGLFARGYRSSMGALASYLERFDPPPDLEPITIPPDPKEVPMGPWRPGEHPPEAQPTVLVWFHPLAGPRRAMPWSESRRFGAERPQPRPAECELGHCGVDLGSSLGEPVFAVFEGVVERIERDENKGGRAGRYIRIGHQSGRIVTRYIHLDTIREGLHEGDKVHGGQLIGRIGHTGIEHSGPHLHFGLSKRDEGGHETYFDPEPYLREWQLPDASAAMVASYTPR
jgi:murein DD-endopeptidase MepM/ murein hydrolase activator NlpD